MSLTVPRVVVITPRQRPGLTLWRFRLVVPILLIGALALATRLHGIAGKPYWLDEITTLRRSSLGFGALVRDSLSFHHLPLYFVVSSGFVPFGLEESVMRLPAAIFGAVSCVVLFLIGRTLGDWRSGLAASLLLALAPFQVQYGQEARSYTLVTTLILFGLWGLLLLARDPQAAARRWRDPASPRGAWILYGVGTALALDTLSVALFWLLAANLGAAIIAFRSPSCRRGFLRNWILAQLPILAVYLPFIVAMALLTDGNMGSGLDWVPPLSLRNAWDTLQTVYLMRLSSLIAFRIFPGPLDLFGIGWFGWIVAALAVLGLVAAIRRGITGVVLAVALLTLPVCLAASSVVSSLWMPRYLMWSGPIFFLAAGLGVLRLPRRLVMPGLVVLGVLGSANLSPYYRAETKPLWNKAALVLLEGRQVGDLLITDNPATVNMMNVYLSRTGHALGPADWTTEPEVAAQRQAAGGRVWAVHGTVGQNDPYEMPDFLDSLSMLGPASSVQRIGIDITLLLFEHG